MSDPSGKLEPEPRGLETALPEKADGSGGVPPVGWAARVLDHYELILSPPRRDADRWVQEVSMVYPSALEASRSFSPVPVAMWCAAKTLDPLLERVSALEAFVRRTEGLCAESGCGTGDCPHGTNRECYLAMIEFMEGFGEAAALLLAAPEPGT